MLLGETDCVSDAREERDSLGEPDMLNDRRADTLDEFDGRSDCVARVETVDTRLLVELTDRDEKPVRLVDAVKEGERDDDADGGALRDPLGDAETRGDAEDVYDEESEGDGVDRLDSLGDAERDCARDAVGLFVAELVGDTERERLDEAENDDDAHELRLIEGLTDTDGDGESVAVEDALGVEPADAVNIADEVTDVMALMDGVSPGDAVIPADVERLRLGDADVEGVRHEVPLVLGDDDCEDVPHELRLMDEHGDADALAVSDKLADAEFVV